jgi:D-glycerate 3-kinase
MALAHELFAALQEGRETVVPQYDKSAHNGMGDRVAESGWKTVNASGRPKAQVIILEGWCVGFRALSADEVTAKHADSRFMTLKQHTMDDLLFVNEKLKAYDVITDLLNCFVHIDAQNLKFVYEWRLEQEFKLRKEKGAGMTDEQVIKFVDGYYPAYELYTEGVKQGVVKKNQELAHDDGKRQLRVEIAKDRSPTEVEVV